MSRDNDKRFADLTFEDFRRMANDVSLSRYEKIGFPNSYRAGQEPLIWRDIVGKLPALLGYKKTVLDVGPGCSELPLMLIDLCQKHGHRLLLVDSPEMLDQLPDEPFIEKHAGVYPDCAEMLERFRGRVDVLLSYSVLHYVFAEGNIWNFLDASLQLLSHGGEMLLGDIPNASKRNRFFSTPAGVDYHRGFTGNSDETPEVNFNEVRPGSIDDAVILGLLHRARLAGCDSHVVPQAPELPMANRREDILIRRP